MLGWLIHRILLQFPPAECWDLHLTSFEALRRTIERHGKENTHAIFADTSIEDEDLYRFLNDQKRYFCITIERVKDVRTPGSEPFAALHI